MAAGACPRSLRVANTECSMSAWLLDPAISCALQTCGVGAEPFCMAFVPSLFAWRLCRALLHG
eukprot:326422-Chlamydomonas_euryale.AAC.1